MNDWIKEEFPDLSFTDEAKKDLNKTKNNSYLKAQYKAVAKTLRFINNRELQHNSLQTHKYHSKSGANAEKILQSYAQNNTPGAYRVFWHFGPEKGEITIVAITPHP